MADPKRSLELAVAEQLYLLDSADDFGEVDTDEIWDDEGVWWRVGVDGTRAIGISLSDDPREESRFQVDFVLRGSRPGPGTLRGWDHVVEASLKLGSSVLLVEEQHEIRVASRGSYRLRVSFGDLRLIEEEASGVRYRVELWKSAVRPPKLVRCWPGFELPPPPEGPAGGRSFSGTSAFRRALKSMQLEPIAERTLEVVPPFDTATLLRATDGSLWEYTNPLPSGMPLLVEITASDARKQYKVRKT